MKIPGTSLPERGGAGFRPLAEFPAKSASGAAVPRIVSGASQSRVPYTALFASLGLPSDRLSASLISFVRFFSLPLDGALLTKVYRQASQPGQGSAGAASFRSKEALALAAMAAADKGVELSRAALEGYAAAIDPVDGDEAADKRDNGGGAGGEDSANTEGRGPSGQNPGERDSNSRRKAQDAEIEAPLAGGRQSLKEKILQAAERNPPLDLLNRLPGKNGGRWITLPFSFVEEGKRYRVCLRILLGDDQAARFLVLDLAFSAGEGQGEFRRTFVMDRTSEKNPRLRAYFWPPCPGNALESLARGLAAFMDLPPERVSAQNRGAPFSFAENSGDELLLSINEVV